VLKDDCGVIGLPQLLSEPIAVTVWKVHLHECQVDRTGPGRVDGISATAGLDHLVSQAAKRHMAHDA
jgi:hypothetical protein